MSWTTEAEAKLKEIPFFVRPAARKKIEKFAQEQGVNEITAEIYDLAKQQFGWEDRAILTNSFGSPFEMMRRSVPHPTSPFQGEELSYFGLPST